RLAGPLDPNIRYLSVHTLHDIFDIDQAKPGKRWKGIGSELYLGNTAGYAGLDFVNGYSPLMSLGMQQLFRWEIHGCFLEAEDAERILVSETGPQGLLQLVGVDGLVVSERFMRFGAILAKHGWSETAQVEGGRVFHRKGPLSPRVRSIEQADLI